MKPAHQKVSASSKASHTMQFEAVSHLDPHEREAVQTMIAGVLHMHDAKRWQQSARCAERDAHSGAGTSSEEDRKQTSGCYQQMNQGPQLRPL